MVDRFLVNVQADAVDGKPFSRDEAGLTALADHFLG